jgi:monofunctional biosynthetic peptidoglycan transglycosylase
MAEPDDETAQDEEAAHAVPTEAAALADDALEPQAAGEAAGGDGPAAEEPIPDQEPSAGAGMEPSLASSEIAVEPEPEAEQAPRPAPEPPLIRTLPPPEPRPAAPARRRRRGFFGRLAMLVLVLGVAAPLLAVVVSRFTPPLMTPLMALRLTEGRGWDYRWRPISEISPALVQAAVAAEDARFCSHRGFDFSAMQKAMAHNEKRPGKVRGGSTISQQAAKNVFLWPARSYVRKGLEAYFTVLTEAVWGKRRIMEVYLNVAEWGPGIYGAQAASERYFGVDAADLTPSQASRLAAILPSPLKWKAVHPGRYVARRSRRIVAASGTVRADGLAACVYR